MDEYKSRLSDYLTDLVREELEKYDGGFTDEWNDQRKKNAEVLGYELSGTGDISEEITDWQGGYNDEFKFKKGQLIKDINPDCPHHGSEGEVTKVTKDEVTYTVRNNGKTYKVGDELTKTKDQLTPLSLEESINERRGISIGEKGMVFFLDQLVNSMEHYNEREFARGLGKKLGINSKVMGRIWKNYDKVHASFRDKWTDRHWERWLNKQGITEDTKRDYKAEYKKFQSSTKAKKYRAELNQYNRKKGTYGNKDGKDASHKGGKIAGFEKESTNRGRREKSRLKKESINEGKWSKIMRSVRKGSKAGPWSIVVYKNKKVLHQRLVKILQQIPAHYEDVKKKYPNAKIGIEDKYGDRVYTESVNEANLSPEQAGKLFDKLLKKQTKGNLPSTKDIEIVFSLMRKKYGIKNESVNESDLGLTLKKGKTITVTHKKSGKELVIIDKPNVKREYEKIGYFAEGKVDEISMKMQPFSSQEAKLHINADIKDMSKHLGKASQQVIKIMMDGVRKGKYTPMDISRGIQEGPTRRTHFGEMTFIQSLWTKMREKFRKYSKDGKLS